MSFDLKSIAYAVFQRIGKGQWCHHISWFHSPSRTDKRKQSYLLKIKKQKTYDLSYLQYDCDVLG